MEKATTSSFGSMLKRFRQRRKLSQQKLAEKVERSRESVSLWERGLERPDTHGVMLDLIKELRLDEEEKRLFFEARYGTPAILPFHNLPEKNPYFTGREDLLDDLHQRLVKGKDVALRQAVSGLGGVGKTQLAVEYAYRYQTYYHDILWAEAESYEALTTAYINLASLLLLPEREQQDQNVIISAVKRWLSTHKDWLLILDNIEDLSLVSKFVPAGRRGTILLTTQRQVAESIAQTIEVKKMPEEEGALFLLKRAHYLALDSQSHHDFLPKNAVATAQDISCEVDGLPLALDQAGAYILETGCSLADYLVLYRQRREKLLQRRGEVYTDHPASVATTFSLAFERAAQRNPAASKLLHLFAFLAPDDIPEEIVFEGAPHLDSALQSLAYDALAFNDAVVALRTFSLIHRDRVKKMLTVHRLVQAVLIDSMDTQTQRQWAERTVKIMNHLFPTIDGVKREPAQRYILHAQACAKLIDQWSMEYVEATRLLHEAGSYFSMVGQYQQAEHLLKRSLEMREYLLGLEHPDVAASLNNLALLYQAQGNNEQAEPLLLRALKIVEQAEGSEGTHIPAALTNMALSRQTQGKYEQAEPLLLHALYIDTKRFGPVHREVATDLNNLAELYRIQGKYEQAESFCLPALSIREHMLGQKDPHTISSYNNLALIFHKQGKYPQSEMLYQRVLTNFEEAYGSEHPDLATSLVNFALLYEDWEKYEEASQFYQRASAIYECMLGPDHPTTLSIQERNATLLRRMNEED